MSVFKDFIETVGLDHSFFYQFVIIALLYFVTKKLFLEKYYKDLEKRRESTKGSFSQSKKMEEKLQELEKTYTKKAQDINKNFQDAFASIKDKAESDFAKNKEILQQDFLKNLTDQKNQLLKNRDQEEQKLEKDLPSLVQSLVDKIVGRA